MRSAALLRLPRQALRARFDAGFAIDPRALAGAQYRGTSLGLPGVVDRLLWKTFRKAFHADAATGKVVGWNVRVAQGDAAFRPLEARGRPVTFGRFVVGPARGALAGRAVELDYSCAGHVGRAGPLGRLRDPLIALEAGSVDLLLGYSEVAAFGRRVGTPSWFVLERAEPVDFVAW